MRSLARVCVALLFAACTAGGEDTGDTADTGDTGTPVPLEGYGTISGDCGVLDDGEWGSSDPFFFRNAITFDVGFDPDLLSEGGQEVIEDGNLGGSSINSEAMAYEMLYRCELAALLLTEGEVTYDDPGGKKTDLVVDIDGRRIGVSVTRAVGWPRDDPYTLEAAQDLLLGKLADIPLSSDNVVESDAWERQLLSVLAYTDDHAARLEEAWASSALDAVRGDTGVMVTATGDGDAFIYEN